MTTQKFRNVNGQIVAAALHESSQPLAVDGATPSGTPQQTHAETLDRLRELLALPLSIGTHHISVICDQARIDALNEAIAALRAPVGTCETCRHYVNEDGITAAGRCDGNTPVNHTYRDFGCIFHTPRPETPQEQP